MQVLSDSLKVSIGKNVQINTRVDPNLLGGLIVKVGSRMIDSSLRTKLDNLKVAMKGIGLMDIRASEISSILKEQIKNFGKEAEVSEIGQVLVRR